MTAFFSLLESRVSAVDSLLCIGLDPHPALLPAATAEAARAFCLRIIEQTAPCAAAFKPNAAFFEAFGPPGWEALRQVIAAARHSGAPVILDAKRGDIASTAEAYARSAFEYLGAQAITVNPYLGGDSLAPFTRQAEHGVFLLCKTSNPGSADLQDAPLAADGAPLYEHVARLAARWNERNNLGLVVGATHPQALARLRSAAPGLWFLTPGVGAQGGDLRAAVQAGLRPDGLGMLVSVSRGIARAEQPRRAAVHLRDAIRTAVQEKRRNPRRGTPAPKTVSAPAPPPDSLAPLADALLDLGCVRFGEFTLKSGRISPIYLDLRRLVGAPHLLARIAAAYAALLRGLEFDLLAALPYAALPIGTAVSLHGGWPLVYPRKETKTYGTKAAVEGVYRPGQRAVVLDDLITTGDSKLEGIARLTAAGLAVRDIVVLIDRQSGGADFMARYGYRLHSVFTLPRLLAYWEQRGAVEARLLAKVRAFLQ